MLRRIIAFWGDLSLCSMLRRIIAFWGDLSLCSRPHFAALRLL